MGSQRVGHELGTKQQQYKLSTLDYLNATSSAHNFIPVTTTSTYEVHTLTMSLLDIISPPIGTYQSPLLQPAEQGRMTCSPQLATPGSQPGRLWPWHFITNTERMKMRVTHG